MESLASKVIRTHATIPGVQAKIFLDLQKTPGAGKAARLTLVGLWGRFILNPPTEQYPALPEVEATTMRLADAAGIRTVPHALIRLKSGELAYITRRIDRVDGSKKAMEDMCQLTGNADMHLKNFSLWRPAPGEIQLSPSYDLVATKLLLAKDPEESALALNGKKKNLRRKDFDALAASFNLAGKSRENAYSVIAKTMAASDAVLKGSMLTAGLQRTFRSLLKARCQQLGF